MLPVWETMMKTAKAHKWNGASPRDAVFMNDCGDIKMLGNRMSCRSGARTTDGCDRRQIPDNRDEISTRIENLEAELWRGRSEGLLASQLLDVRRPTTIAIVNETNTMAVASAEEDPTPTQSESAGEFLKKIFCTSNVLALVGILGVVSACLIRRALRNTRRKRVGRYSVLSLLAALLDGQQRRSWKD